MKIIYDIDCLLYFLRIKRTDLLEAEFDRIVISNKVFNSLNNPSIPDFIKEQLNIIVEKEFVKVEEISYNTKAFDIYYELIDENKDQILGSGEASSIAIAVKNNGTIAYTNPDAIKDYLEKYDLRCITLEDMLNALFKKGTLSKKEFEELLSKSNNY